MNVVRGAAGGIVKILFTALLVLPLLLVDIAQSPAAAEPSVVTAEGKYVMGDLDSKKDARMLAVMEAKRIALEKAGTYVESSSEVKDFSLTKDQINTLAAGIMSVDILKEEWKMSGESMMAVILIRATIDTAHLRDRIRDLHDEKKPPDDSDDIRKQLAALQKELAELKEKKGEAADGKKAAPELREQHDKIMTKMTALDLIEDGNRALGGRQWDRSLAAFTAAVAADPALSDAYAGQAAALLQTGRTAEAMEKIDTALKLSPKTARNHAVKALILHKQRKNKPALASINRAIELRPQAQKLYLTRSEILLSLRDRKAAIEDLGRACKLGNVFACRKLEQASTTGPRQAPPRRPR